MKKGLLTVLLASLVLVGCQNYDDQFDDLNAQISAFTSWVDDPNINALAVIFLDLSQFVFLAGKHFAE